MRKFLKRLLYIVLSIIVLFCVLMLLPRTIAALSPHSKPIGYHFLFADYIALGVGLEKMVDTKPEIPGNVEEIKNIEYANVNGKSLQLDLYRPKQVTAPAPLLVFIHGGGWVSGQRSDYLVYLAAFAEKGYVTATVSYRLLADSCYPACVEDVQKALKWLFDHHDEYGYDPARIAVIGGSAGGHLSLLAGLGWHRNNAPDSTGTRSGIRAIVDFYGPVDLTTGYARTHPLVTNFIAHSYAQSPDLYTEASPSTFLDSNDPPILIFQGSSDNLVPASQSVFLKKRCDELGVPAELYNLPLWPHSMDVVLRVNNFAQEKMNTFFEKYLR